MSVEIVEMLHGIPASEWMPNPPATSESVVALENKYQLKLPADYRELLNVASGGELAGHRTRLNLEPTDELFWHNEDPSFVEHLPGMFVIGDDTGDALFYYDPKNKLGKGAYSIFMVDFGAIGFPHSKYAAASLTGLIEAILANEQIREHPYLGPLNDSGVV